MVTLMVIKKIGMNTHIKTINNVKSVINNFKNAWPILLKYDEYTENLDICNK